MCDCELLKIELRILQGTDKLKEIYIGSLQHSLEFSDGENKRLTEENESLYKEINKLERKIRKLEKVE